MWIMRAPLALVAQPIMWAPTCLPGFGSYSWWQVFGVFLSDTSAWRWATVVGTAVVAAAVSELFVRMVLSARLAGGAAITSGALAATVVGCLRFPPIMISSPHPTTFSVVGAIVSGWYWLMLQLVLFNSKSGGLHAADCFKICWVLIVAGTAGGALVGVLTRGVIGLLFCTPLGFLGGILLGAPYYVMGVLTEGIRE